MLYIIVGPTCSNKTMVATKLSDYFLCAPIVSVDAFQIYRDMDIGTAKIEKGSPYYKRHHLIDFVSPERNYSVKDYQDDFRRTISELSKDNKNIIVVGGTGLYLRASLYDYDFSSEINDDTSDLEELDNDTLYKMLEELDFEATKTIHKNNRKRVIRAISIARTSSLNKSDNIQNQKHEYIYKEDEIKIFFININREELYSRINARVDEMVKNGLVDEVKTLLSQYDLSLTARQAIGYKEIISYLNGEMDLDTAIELIKKRTRNYAKRQVTFFKHQFNTIEVDGPNKILEMIKNER